MITRRFISIFIVVTILLSFSTFLISAQEDNYIVKEVLLKEQFSDGQGPIIDDYSLDYKYYSPVKNGDNTKYPLVIWLHGLGNNSSPGSQLNASDIENWSTVEYQKRFKNSGGAFIFAPRSPKTIGWDDTLINPLKGAIDDFIQKNKNNIDISRIYLGGYSMGGWMALKTASIYPEMFAAIFVSCPAWGISNDTAEKISSIPIWIVGGTNDLTVNYYTTILPTWNKIIKSNNTPEICRFSTLDPTTYPNGEKASDGHFSWYAITNDMFASNTGNYPNMTTINGVNNEIQLIFPEGMISWLCSKTSDYSEINSSNENIKISILSLLLNFIEKFIQLFNNVSL